MNNKQIEKDLRTWFDTMVNKYSWLKIKFEYNNDRSVWLVSFAPVDQVETSDDFNKDAMMFANDMNAKYGIDAPLFTDGEELFKLSLTAETVVKQRIFAVKVPIFSSDNISTGSVWQLVPRHVTAKVNGNCHAVFPEYEYASVA